MAGPVASGKCRGIRELANGRRLFNITASITMDSLLISLPLCLALSVASAFAEDTALVIDVDHPVGQVSPMHYGLMTEEINHSYDGGLYAELVQNRAFLDNAETPVHWSLVQGTGAVGRHRSRSRRAAQ